MADEVVQLAKCVVNLAEIVDGLQNQVLVMALRIKELEENESKKL